MSALRLINETEITSSVSSVNVTDVFSADFDIYKVTTDNMISASGTPALDLKYLINKATPSVLGAYLLTV